MFRNHVIGAVWAESLAVPSDPLDQRGYQRRNRHPFLVCGVTITHGNRVVFHCLMVNCYAVGRTDFVLAAIAPSNRTCLIVGDVEIFLE